jgi:Cu/Ag efflux pump CusA
MKRLIQWSIEHYWLVIGLSVLLAASGLWTARQMPVDVFPDLTAPTVTILTGGARHGPRRVGVAGHFPYRKRDQRARQGVRRVRSATAVGIAVVWVEFDWGTDIFMARQLVSEKLSLVSAALPPRWSGPSLRRFRRSWEKFCSLRCRPDTDDQLELRTVTDTLVRRRLLAIQGSRR